jgi:PAS domain S-box-containing protein
MAGSIQDITEQVLAERELRSSEALLSEVLSAVPFLVFWKDAEGHYVGCNRAFAEAAGLSSPTEIANETEATLSRRIEPPELGLEIEREVLATGDSRMHVEEIWHTSYGRTLTLDTSRVPLRDCDGVLTGVLGVCIDVTERRQLESRLSQAQKLESIGQLAAGIAHEINTPTQYVSDNTRFLKSEIGKLMTLIDGCEDPQSGSDLEHRFREELDRIDYGFLRKEIPQAIDQTLEGIDRITRILAAMKDFSHPGSGTMEPADINRAIASSVTVCRNRWKYVADLELDLAPDLPLVPCCVPEFNQVMLNLVVNASDAIEERFRGTSRRGLIKVTSRQDCGAVEIRVADNGGGIPDPIRDRVFDPFFTTKDVGKGTGQGLAISRDVIAGKHGGDLLCESSPAHGTTFILRLPLDKDDNNTLEGSPAGAAALSDHDGGERAGGPRQSQSEPIATTQPSSRGAKSRAHLEEAS